MRRWCDSYIASWAILHWQRSWRQRHFGSSTKSHQRPERTYEDGYGGLLFDWLSMRSRITSAGHTTKDSPPRRVEGGPQKKRWTSIKSSVAFDLFSRP